MQSKNELAYAEIDAILELLEDEYANRVPEKVRKFFREEKNKNYKPVIDVNKPLLEQNLYRETIVLLTILQVNYWCYSEQEKQDLLDEFAKNEKDKIELEEKFNPDNLFKKKQQEPEELENKENLQLIQYKEQSIIRKLLNKIKNFFKKSI